jgi:hypothetical protein
MIKKLAVQIWALIAAITGLIILAVGGTFLALCVYVIVALLS